MWERKSIAQPQRLPMGFSPSAAVCMKQVNDRANFTNRHRRAMAAIHRPIKLVFNLLPIPGVGYLLTERKFP